MADIKQYTEETQELFLRFLLSDADLFARCQNIVNPTFFNIERQLNYLLLIVQILMQYPHQNRLVQ